MMNGTMKKMVTLGMAISIFAGIGIVPVHAEVISALDTSEECFFGGSSGTTTESDSSADNFF